jgi:hypothetical protein
VFPLLALRGALLVVLDALLLFTARRRGCWGAIDRHVGRVVIKEDEGNEIEIAHIRGQRIIERTRQADMGLPACVLVRASNAAFARSLKSGVFCP